MKILVDVEERRSAVPRYLRALDVEIEFAILDVGDFVVSGEIVVERKTVADLHRSIANARLWRQVSRLAHCPRRAFLLVEGIDLDAGAISREGVRGALLQVIDNGIAVLRSAGPADTAVWLRLVGIRGDGRTPRGRRGRRRSIVSPAGLLTTVPGISPSLAASLLVRFGSVAGIAAAAPSDLEEVDGIGPMRREALRAALLGTSLQSSEVP